MATRKDVALLANVSVTMVSRVMNNAGYVSKEKREAVQKAAKTLNYKPNPIALSLQKKETRQLVFYVKYLSNNYFLELYKGMMSYAQQQGYLVFISGDLHIQKINELMIDGVILPSEEFAEEQFVKYIKRIQLPYVTLGYGSYIPENTYSVTVNTPDGMRLALDYLQAMGHQKIAYACSNVSNTNDPRYFAYCQRMQDVCKECLNNFVLGKSGKESLFTEINYFESGVLAAQQFVERKLDATAVICFNDDMAIGFNIKIQELGLRVPKDISIISFDGQLLGQYTTPKLTSVNLNIHEHGMKSAQVLIDVLRGNDVPFKHSIGVDLIERNSVAKIE